jgi:S-adenosylmethionine:tRNA ribosyltransferase-isomerase
MLQAFATIDTLSAAYHLALDEGFLWHEFGDSHLILEPRSA